jgi:hypothetical protein
VLLTLKDHLLETEDDLILAILGHLLVEVGPGLAAILLVASLDLLLGLVINILFGFGFGHIPGRFLGGSSIPLGRIRIGRIRHVFGILLGISAVDILCLALELLLGEVRLLVPDVILGGLVDVGQFFLRGLDPAGSIGSRIAGNVAEDDGRIFDYNRGLV